MSDQKYLRAMERKNLITTTVALAICVVATIWHGPSFALCAVTAVAAIYLIVKLAAFRRLGSRTTSADLDRPR